MLKDDLDGVLIMPRRDVLPFLRAVSEADRWEKETARRFAEGGPASASYRSALHELALVWYEAGRSDKALAPARECERAFMGRLSDDHMECRYLLGRILLSLGKYADASAAILPAYEAASTPALGQWSGWWHAEFGSLYADLLEARKQKSGTAAALRYSAWKQMARQYGPTLTETAILRLKFALTLEGDGKWREAAVCYLASYKVLRRRRAFPSPEVRLGILCHFFRAATHDGIPSSKQGAAVEVWGWIQNLVRSEFGDDPAVHAAVARAVGKVPGEKQNGEDGSQAR